MRSTASLAALCLATSLTTAPAATAQAPAKPASPAGGPAAPVANIGSPSAGPAATLLLPYFEQDLVNPNVGTTIFKVVNRSPNATLARVTLWTDRGVPTYGFDVYLGGYDLVEVDMRLVFNGIVPQTSETLSNAGSLSGPHVVFPNCAGNLAQGRIPAATVTELRNAHRGLASTLLTGALCGGKNYGDQVARGYVTVDAANQCSAANVFPGSPGYFISGGQGVASNNNVLMGDWWVIDRTNNFSYGDTMVHIEADAQNPLVNGAGDYTFYGRLAGVNGSAADNREPLATNVMSRYLNGGTFTGGTDAIVWRDPGAMTSFPCGAPPAGLSQPGFAVFNEQEQISVAGTSQAFPLAAEKINLATVSRFSVPFSFGVIYYNLNLATTVAPFGVRNQGFVTHVFKSNGRFAGAVPGWQIDNASNPLLFTIFTPPPCSDGIDNDGDGLIDFPADPGCASSQGIENPQCNDGFDNDGDTFIDFPADPGCASASDTSESAPPPFQCSDGIDNDGDGLIDFPNDPGCSGATSNIENPQCNDGLDNDADTFIDFPADPGCVSASDSQELNPACNDGIDNDGDTFVDFPADPGCASANAPTENPQCNNGIDDDGDGLVDLADPGCGGVASSNDEKPACRDGIDNDGDALIDFPNDPKCSDANDRTETPDCGDGLDNDLDTFIDFPADPGCASAADINEKPGTTTRQCSDGLDNDGDGLVDYPADTGCISRYDDNEFNPL